MDRRRWIWPGVVHVLRRAPARRLSRLWLRICFAELRRISRGQISTTNVNRPSGNQS
jgi:hypothetical protein